MISSCVTDCICRTLSMNQNWHMQYSPFSAQCLPGFTMIMVWYAWKMQFSGLSLSGMMSALLIWDQIYCYFCGVCGNRRVIQLTGCHKLDRQVFLSPVSGGTLIVHIFELFPNKTHLIQHITRASKTWDGWFRQGRCIELLSLHTS